MAKITFYQKPTCTKCRQTRKILETTGVDFKDVHYYETPLSKNKIQTLLKKLNMEPRDLIRKGEKTYKDLNLKDESLTKAELVAFMTEYPDLIQRPIIEKGDKAVLGRPPENVKKIL